MNVPRVDVGVTGAVAMRWRLIGEAIGVVSLLPASEPRVEPPVLEQIVIDLTVSIRDV